MKKWLIPALSALCVLTIGLMIYVLTRQPVRTDDFVPPAFDEAALFGTPDVPGNLGYSPVKVEDAFSAYICGTVILDGNTADVYFTSDSKNTLWLKLRVLDEVGHTTGETGLIRPGEYVKTVKFDTVPENGAQIRLKIMAYEPETYYSGGAAVLNTTAKRG